MIQRLLAFALALLVCPSLASAQTVTNIGLPNVKAADDFATRAFQDPWDMNERTDIAWWLNSADQPLPNMTGITFAGGMFSGTSTELTAIAPNFGDPSLFLLESGNPFAARLGKVGTNYPIDANTYKFMAFRMKLDNATKPNLGFAQIQFLWNRETIFDTTTTSTAADTIRGSAGFRIYLVDLSALAHSNVGADGFAWGGTIKTLRLDPTQLAPDTIQLDWARLVSVDATTCRTITWTGGGATVDIYLIDSATSANLGPIALGVNGTSGNAASASAGCSTTGAGYKYFAGALAPGTYKVAVVSSGFTPVAGNFSSTTWVVNDAPTMTFTSPSEEGSTDDFATTVLGNAWDMTSLTDIDRMTFVNNPRIESMNLETPAGVALPAQTVFRGTSVAGPSAGFGDPQVGLMWNPGRGGTARIDPTKYRILTLEMGVPNFARNINDGSIARITWRVAGNDANGESVSDDIIFNSRAGVNVLDKVIVDMADRTVMSIEQGATAGWVRGSAPNPGLDIFRVDPHEYTPATDFFIRRVKLASFERTTGLYTIKWQYTDSSGAGTVDLFYDTDASGFDGVPITTNLNAANGALGYTWNTVGVTAPSVFIHAIFRDASGNENRVYAKWPVLLTNNASPEVSVNRAVLNYGVTTVPTKTSSQTVRVTITGSGAPCWAVTNPVPALLSVTPTTGLGNGSFTVSLIDQAFATGSTNTQNLTVGPCSGSPIANAATVRVSIRALSQGQVPTGVMDTPVQNATVSGSIAVTGWVIDDIETTSVVIYRDPVVGESGRILLGTAVRVDDSRTDIEAASPDTPFNYRAGWGYLLLTNFLPNSGDGTYVLQAYASDRDGHEVLLGTRTIIGANSSSGVPFGAIDTPAQGATISGTAYNNFGWVLARAPGRADPPAGGTVTVFIDSLAVGSPSGWTSRSDLTSLFPAATYPGIVNAAGVYTFNTTAYQNGVHTIAWLSVANNGLADGIGSRYFTVVNGSALTSTLEANVIAAPAPRWAGRSLGARVPDARLIDAASGVTLSRRIGRTSPRAVRPDADGVRLVAAHALEPIAIGLGRPADGAAYEGYTVVNGTLRPLPMGSSFDEQRGVFSWLPGLGFGGVHDLLFVRGDRTIPVRVVITPTIAARRGSVSAPFAGLFLE